MNPSNMIPLFPLNTVLVPGGYLPLRIFEQRYLDMVRECSHEESGFGICLVGETDEPGVVGHARVGTVAHIRDFYTLDDGLLGITAFGGSRFRIRQTKARDNGLLIGEVDWLQEPEPAAVSPAHAVLVRIAEQFIDKLDAGYPGFQPGMLQDAAWLSFRLTEWLPIDNDDRQVLLEVTDPEERLQRLLEAIPKLSSAETDE